MALSSVLLVSKLLLDQEGDGALFCVVGFKPIVRPGRGWCSLLCVGFKTMVRPGGGWRSLLYCWFQNYG